MAEGGVMEQFLVFLKQNMFWITIIVVVVVTTGLQSIRSILVTQARERTRREIAAYIAEGSMTPEQGERLMHAGRGGGGGSSCT